MNEMVRSGLVFSFNVCDLTDSLGGPIESPFKSIQSATKLQNAFQPPGDSLPDAGTEASASANRLRALFHFLV